MKTISYAAIVEAVSALCKEAALRLPADVRAALTQAEQTERSERGRDILRQCLTNADIAADQAIPICQDTGVAVFFVELGGEVLISGGRLEDAIQEGTARGYTEGFLRSSIVGDPLFDRKNRGDNTPAIVHLELTAGESLSITLAPKGGGSENMSGLAMLKPSQGREGVSRFVVHTVVSAGGNPCPPVIVGVGIGGTAEKAMLLAKKALLRPLGQPHPDQRYAGLEAEILERINASGVGPQGLGGSVTALAVHIEPFPCHIASLPVAVCLNCHVARHATVVL